MKTSFQSYTKGKKIDEVNIIIKDIMDKKNFAFDRMNYILLAVGMAVVVLGFILMSGSGSTETSYDPDIFSARRIKVAPAVCLLGFVSMIYAVIRKPKA